MKQQAHIRKYKGGKKVVVNPNIKAKKKPQRTKSFDKSAELITAAILFPIISFQGESFPKVLKDQIPMLRMIQVMKDPKEFINYATDQEALGYLSTMSMKAPLKTSAKNVFTSLFNKTMPKEKHQEITKPLTAKEKDYLKEIKSYIRRKQWQKYREANK